MTTVAERIEKEVSKIMDFGLGFSGTIPTEKKAIEIATERIKKEDAPILSVKKNQARISISITVNNKEVAFLESDSVKIINTEVKESHRKKGFYTKMVKALLNEIKTFDSISRTEDSNSIYESKTGVSLECMQTVRVSMTNDKITYQGLNIFN